jgi:5'-nucleotidase
MRILLTNDDGIEAPGLKALMEILGPLHDVWIVAPENEKSGSSHSITLRDSIRVRKIQDRRFSCRGNPVDCVMVALLGLLPKGIEMVISGINHGPNLGTDILYSGTASAASQAVLMGVPSIAVSIGSYAPPFDFAGAAVFIARNLPLFRELSDDDHFLNINYPNAPGRKPDNVITFPSRRIYRDELHTYEAPNKDVFCFIGGPIPDSHLEEGSDCQVLAQGKVSISPIHVHPANCGSIEEQYRSVKFL